MTQWDDEAREDAAFTRLFAALPEIQPSAAFVDTTVAAAFEVRAKRYRLLWLSVAAGVVVVAGATLLLAAFGMPSVVVLLAAESAAGMLMASVWAATGIAEFWSVMLRGGAAAARVAVMPQSVALLVMAEVIGGLALYMLHRLLRSEVRLRNSGPLCI
jgi:hypothetical protein